MAYDLVTSQKFDITIMMVIMINTVAMCIEHEDQSQELTNIMEKLNNIFVRIFAIEFLLKVTGLRL